MNHYLPIAIGVCIGVVAYVLAAEWERRHPEKPAPPRYDPRDYLDPDNHTPDEWWQAPSEPPVDWPRPRPRH